MEADLLEDDERHTRDPEAPASGGRVTCHCEACSCLPPFRTMLDFEVGQVVHFGLHVVSRAVYIAVVKAASE